MIIAAATKVSRGKSYLTNDKRNAGVLKFRVRGTFRHVRYALEVMDRERQEYFVLSYKRSRGVWVARVAALPV